MPGEIVIAHSFDPKFISLSSPTLIFTTGISALGYLSQLFFRLYLKFFKNIEESNELLKWYLVIILGVAYVIPTVTMLLGISIYWSACVTFILQFGLIPGMILLCHENVHQYYFSNHPKLHTVETYVKHLFNICLPQPQEIEPNLHEPVVIDDMALESNLQVIASQAAARLALARQAVQNEQPQGLQTPTTHNKAHAENTLAQQPQVKDPQHQVLDAHVLMLQNPQAQNPQAKNLPAQNLPTQNLQALKPKNTHSMSEVNI